MSSHDVVSPGFRKGTVISAAGEVLVPPEGWEFLPAGDGPLTRKVKQQGACWQVQVKKGRRTLTKGIWCHGDNIRAAKREIDAKRSEPGYERRRKRDRQRREQQHAQYVAQFYQQTLIFLNFHPDHEELAMRLARAVTEHATPIGSGTVARTARIPLAERVEAAVIAWLRHRTTSYDSMHIARIKGRRREVRRMLAERSRDILYRYRSGGNQDPACPLYRALEDEQEGNATSAPPVVLSAQVS